MLPIKKLLSRNSNTGGKRNTSVIKFLVYHYTGNRTDTALANANYFHNNYVGASAHYFVDDNNIYQSVLDDVIAWAVGSTRWLDQGSPYASKGHKFWQIANNTNSISIEMCCTNGIHTEKTLKNAKELGQMLCNKYNIKEDHVIRHFDVNGKICPLTMVTNEAKWKEFKKGIGKGSVSIQVPVTTPEKLDVDGLFGELSTMKLQSFLGINPDGTIGGQTDPCKPYIPNWTTATFNDGFTGSLTVSLLQKFLKAKGYKPGSIDGLCGKKTVKAWQNFLKDKGFEPGAIDGIMGSKTAAASQRWLNKKAK